MRLWGVIQRSSPNRLGDDRRDFTSADSAFTAVEPEADFQHYFAAISRPSGQSTRDSENKQVYRARVESIK